MSVPRMFTCAGLLCLQKSTTSSLVFLVLSWMWTGVNRCVCRCEQVCEQAPILESGGAASLMFWISYWSSAADTGVLVCAGGAGGGEGGGEGGDTCVNHSLLPWCPVTMVTCSGHRGAARCGSLTWLIKREWLCCRRPSLISVCTNSQDSTDESQFYWSSNINRTNVSLYRPK